MFSSFMADLIGIACSPSQSVKLAKEHGFAGVDLRIGRDAGIIEAHGVERLADEIRAAGLKAGYCSLQPQKMPVDDVAWRQAMADLPRLAGIAERLGYTRTSTVMLPFHESLGFDAAFDEHVTRLKQAMPILRDHGLRLGIEYVSPVTRRAGQANIFIHDLAGTLDLLNAVDEEGLGLMLDTFHWHCAGESRADIARLRNEQVVVVHVNDAIADRGIDQQVVTERELPGDSGVIDLNGFMQGLRDINYDGPITAEPTHPKWMSMEVAAACRCTAVSVNRLCRMG